MFATWADSDASRLWACLHCTAATVECLELNAPDGREHVGYRECEKMPLPLEPGLIIAARQRRQAASQNRLLAQAVIISIDGSYLSDREASELMKHTTMISMLHTITYLSASFIRAVVTQAALRPRMKTNRA